MNKTIFTLLIITVLNSFAQTKKVSIDKNSFGSYPAILFDIDNGTLTQLNKKESEAETFRGIAIENGLFIVEINKHSLYKFLIISFDKENEKLEFEYEELE